MAERITKDNFEEKVLKSELPVLVEFYSDSCVACKRLSPVLGDFEDNNEGKINVYKLNTNFDAEVALQYKIMGNPTLLIVKNGETVARRTGALSASDLEKWVNENL